MCLPPLSKLLMRAESVYSFDGVLSNQKNSASRTNATDENRTDQNEHNGDLE